MQYMPIHEHQSICSIQNQHMYYNYWYTSSSFVIKITVADRLCTQDGVWNTIAYNDTVYAFCNNGNGVRYRQCVFDGMTTSWGEIHDESSFIRTREGTCIHPVLPHLFGEESWWLHS